MKYILFFAQIMIVLISCSSFKNDKPEAQQKALAKQGTELVKIHGFFDKKEEFLGDVYAKMLNDSVFTSMVITRSVGQNIDTLYSANSEGFFLGNGDLDLNIYKPGFYGYWVVLKKKDYIVLNGLGDKGKTVSDNITIEWNYTSKKFEVMKTP